MGRHEGDEPGGKNTRTLAKVVLGDGCDGEHGERTVDGRKRKHAPPDCVVGVSDERLEEHGTDGH